MKEEWTMEQGCKRRWWGSGRERRRWWRRSGGEAVERWSVAPEGVIISILKGNLFKDVQEILFREIEEIPIERKQEIRKFKTTLERDTGEEDLERNWLACSSKPKRVFPS